MQQNLTKDTLIIEIASGLSPRSLQFKEYKYAELDISPVIDVKKEIYKTMGLVELTKSLYGTDVTNTDELNKNLNKILKDKNYNKVIVLIEGLFWYLTRNEIENMTKLFIKALKGIDWMMITSDCPPYQKFEADFRNVISCSAKVKKGITFADYEDFSLFFKNLGLTNKNYKLSHFVKYDDLSSAKFFNVKEEDAIERIEKYTDVAILKN